MTHDKIAMGKLTVRADGDSVERLEALDTSDTEVLRQDTLGYSLPRRGDELVEERLRAHSADHGVNVDISIEGIPAHGARSVSASSTASEPGSDAKPPSDGSTQGPSQRTDARAQCGRCGEAIDPAHVSCQNCGEQRSRHVFCGCNDELRADRTGDPGCRRRTPAADVLLRA